MVAMMARVADDDLCQAVTGQIRRTPEINSANLNVAVERGMVTLTGFVKCRAEKTAAERGAKQVEGVKVVVSLLEVKPSPERADAEIAQDIWRAFLSHPAVPADRIQVTVSGGHVTLDGVASSRFQKLVAESVVKSLRGIAGVQNNLEVRTKIVHRAEDERGIAAAEAAETWDMANLSGGDEAADATRGRFANW